MMKDMFYSCFAACAIAAFLKVIATSLCGERVLKVLSLFIDGVLFFSLLLFVLGDGQPMHYKWDLAVADELMQTDADMYNEIIYKAEELLSERVSAIIEENFDIKPRECIAELNGENLSLEKLTVFFHGNSLISSYDVKHLLKEEYGVKAEVYFK